MERTPRIAVILDENTSGDGSRYEASKSYFTAIRDAGGLPFGIPYLAEIVGPVVEEFDGLLCVGGRFAYPDDWYLQGKPSKAPPSERFAIERDITAEYLRRKACSRNMRRHAAARRASWLPVVVRRAGFRDVHDRTRQPGFTTSCNACS